PRLCSQPPTEARPTVLISYGGRASLAGQARAFQATSNPLLNERVGPLRYPRTGWPRAALELLHAFRRDNTTRSEGWPLKQMNMEAAEKKLREASFFLKKMVEYERKAFSGKEPFDFYLSAFLSAGMSIRDAFHVRQDRKRNKVVRKWKEDWEACLTP